MRHLIAMPQKSVEGLAQTSQQWIGLACLANGDWQPAKLPATAPYLTTQPVGEKLVPQADAQDRHAGIECLQDLFLFSLEYGFLKLLGTVFTAGKDHGVKVSQVRDNFFQVYSYGGGFNSESLENMVDDERTGRTMDEGDDP